MLSSANDTTASSGTEGLPARARPVQQRRARSQLLSELSSIGTSGTDAGTDSTGSGSLVSALETALESSGASATGAAAVQTDSGVSGGTATSASDPRIQAMINEANRWSGSPTSGAAGTRTGARSGYDCSGFVSAVLHAGGYLSSPQDTRRCRAQPESNPDPAST